MGIIQTLQSKGIYRGYSQHIVALEPILRAMSDRGMPVNQESFASVEARLKADMERLTAEMQALVPDEVKQWKVYKREPKNKDGVVQRDGIWMKPLPWKPSNKALIRYMRHRGHTVPKDFKTKKETTNALEVKRLARSTNDPLYRKILEYRKAQTVLSNHIENWRPGSDGRVHSTFYYDPATGQLSSRRPNVQNAPKHDDPEFGGYAKVFRSMIKAEPGHTIIEFDFKSFHAQTLAFESADPDYLRLARIDIHSYLAARLVNDPDFDKCLAWDDAKLAAYLGGIKKRHKFVRDKKAKPCILGYGFGMGANHLYDANKESFDSKKDAKAVIDALDNSFPITKAWRTTIRQKAHDQGFLISRFGYIRYFWEVFKWQGGEWQPGDDSEAAIAFLPANDAFGQIKDVILRLEALGHLSRYRFINTIHDSLLFHCPDNLLDECHHNVKIEMERPSTVLIDPTVAPHGLSVEVEASAGPDWSSMKGL